MEALKLSPNLEVREINDRAAFVALEQEWNALVERAQNEPFYRHEFIRVWIDNFAPQARLRVLVARDGEGRLKGVLPLMEERAYLYGVPLRQLVSCANVHSCRFDLVADGGGESVSRALFGYLSADSSWDVLRIIDVPEQGKAFGLLEAASEAGFPTGTYQSLSSPYVRLEASWEAQQEKLQTKFKANLRRRRKKLEEKGQVTVERVDSGSALEARLDEGYALEASGWKGQQGTAIALDRATRGFYSELARTEAYQGNLTLYFLRLEGRAVGFHYGLTYDHRYFLLKPGYEEALRECSPGQLLMEEVLKECVQRNLREFDFLGPDMVWKRDWTERLRVHTWLFVFRNDRLGRALCKAKFEWVPAAREVMASWKR